MERRLAAILAADVVGYSRLMGADEAGTLAAVKQHRIELFEPKALQYHGRTVKLMGDGVLMEFPSAVDAVAFAVEVQCAMRGRNEGIPKTRQILYRIGINIGDIIIEDDDIFGDGVNIAARLEGLAEPGGICVARNVLNQVRGKLDLTFKALGRRKVKNITRPVTVYRLALDDKAGQLVTGIQESASARSGWQPYAAALVTLLLITGGIVWWQPWALRTKLEPADTTSVEKASLPLPDKPSIAVLPFTNMSDDKEQEYFSDGMTEDLITGLSKISALTVISRSSTFVYKGKSRDIRTVAKELGASHVIEGSVRKAGARVRITAQLIDAASGTHLWAERYDRKMGELFALQDDVTERIVAALAVKITAREKEAFRNIDRVTTPETYDVFLRGSEALHRFTPEGIEEARGYFLKAIAMDPNFARAYAALGFSYSVSVILTRTDDPEQLIQKSLEYAQKALELDNTLPQGHFSIAMAHLRRGRNMEAIASARQAIKYDPNYADGYAVLANALAYSGKGAEAKLEIQKAMMLNPRYSAPYVEVLARAYYVMGEYDTAIKLLQECVSRDPSSLQCRMLLASAYGLAGETEKAEWEVEEVRSLTPNIPWQREFMAAQFQKAEDKQRYLSGLRKAGVPEE